MQKLTLALLSVLVLIFMLSSCGDDDPCANFLCPTGTTLSEVDGNCDCVELQPSEDVIMKFGLIDTDEVWTADNIYQLNGKVVVNTGATLSIEPGTIIKGAEGTGSLASALIVARGGIINACGTPEAPIVMTSTLDNIQVGQTAGTNLDVSQNGLWGGLIVLGNAPGSFEGDVSEFQIEGIPADDTFGLYGGDDPADNSGSLCYISLRHGGASIGENNEINGLTLGGVGSGTTINQIEIVSNLDDGIEFFGGTVNLTNAVVWSQGDDGFDVDQGYSGTLSNFVYIAGEDSDHGLEIDGPEGSAQGRFTFENGTLIGLRAEIADFRKASMGQVNDCVVINFPDDADLEIDDDESSANYFSGLLEITGFEFVSSLSVSELVHDFAPSGDDVAFDAQMEMNNASVSIATKGANVDVFSWTYAFSKGVLSF
jgi:hypothetical protein